MAASNFKPSLTLTLAYEGGFVNNPNDPGGATNHGVTQKVYDAYRKYHGSKTQSVKLITDIEVADIYSSNYWKLVRGDSLPCGLDYAVFDFAVNSGVSRAIRYLQLAAGVKDDGVIGFITLTAVEEKAKADEIGLITQYCANRLAFVSSLPTFKFFGKGWTRRIVGGNSGYQQNDTGVIDYAVNMAKRSPLFMPPVAIGAREGETAAKAVHSAESEAFPTMEGVSTPAALKALAGANDELARKIGGND